MSVLFVAGAGTEIGKTHVTALLTQTLRAAGRRVLAVKPVASGVPPLDDPDFTQSDTARLLAAQGEAVTRETVEACSPWRFAAPLSPDMAAAREGRTLRLADLVRFHAGACVRAGDGALLVEGAGGLMSPVTADALNLHWLKALGCPVLLVAGGYLGAISHALTAVETLERHDVPLRGVVVSASPSQPIGEDDTAAAIARWTDAPVCFLPRSP